MFRRIYQLLVVGLVISGIRSGLPDAAHGQPFILSSVKTNLFDLNMGSIALADLNGDGQMDILYSGNSSVSSTFAPKAGIGINLGSGQATTDDILFELTELPSGTILGQAFWADYDLDGDLDFLLTGTTSPAPPYSAISTLFNNNNGNFTAEDGGFPGVYSSTVRWADVDNDGDEDLFLAGETNGSQSVAKLYRNNRSAGFEEIETPFSQALFGDAAWGDYDGDGDHDVVISSAKKNGAFTTILYNNDGSGNLTADGQVLQGFAFSAVEWADYDADGDLDLVTSGVELTVKDIFHGKINLYQNSGGTLSRVQSSFDGVFSGDLTFGDYDLDGDLDLFVMGRASLDGTHIGRMYRWENGQFTEATGLVGTSTANAEWIDFDGDNDLDIFVAGRSLTASPFSRLYRNDSRLVNRSPEPPSGLSASVTNDSASLSWNEGSDTETPSSTLSYNIRVGTAPGLSDIFSAYSNPETGRRSVFGPGNVGLNTSWILRDIPIGIYYWGVQTIDNSYTGSVFSEEGQFSIQTSGKITTDVDDATSVPNDLTLYPAYPNPTFTSSTLEFHLPSASRVEIVIYNTLGEEVRSLVDIYASGGSHSTKWDGTSSAGTRVGAGVYFARMRVNSRVFSQKLVLLK